MNRLSRLSRLSRQDPASETDCNSLFRRQIDEAAAVAPFANLAYMASLVVILTYTVPPGRQNAQVVGRRPHLSCPREFDSSMDTASLADRRSTHRATTTWVCSSK
nr:hypothetical protein [Rhodococcus erythropolis]